MVILPNYQSIYRARNWNSAGMRIRPPRSPEPSASGASKWAGVDDGRLPSLSQMQVFMAATILEGGCREASGRIHMNSYEFRRRSWEFGHWLCRSGKTFVRTCDGMTAKPHPSPAHSSRSRAERSTVAQQRRATPGWVEGREFGHPHN